MKKTIKEITRRSFIRNYVVGIGAISLGTYSITQLAGCSKSNPNEPENDNSAVITVNLNLAENQSLTSVGGSLALASNALDNKGILLYRADENTVRAFSRECTHQQCTVGGYNNGIATCPCHGSKYNTSGAVVSGPAPQPLKEYSTSFAGDIVTISP